MPKGKLSEIILTDAYGNVPRGLYHLCKRSNVSTADFDMLTDKYGRDFDAITTYIKEHVEGGMYRAPWPFG